MRETIRTTRSIDWCVNTENPTYILTMPFRAIQILVLFEYTNIIKMKSLLFRYFMCVKTAVLWLVMKCEVLRIILVARNAFSSYQSSRTLYLINCFQEAFEHLVALAL
jgi:hypothetical protein